ncbi:hypothetical protein NDU88_007079 [Pleurodeles waltl]|uniref:Uncharacterized protein n=1 Tax=Pleurodeles waltl TaxID=8319 RepID=A0AAV7QN17_PLEWA|nr:hypothetical protein NDU88_007079 [Pleurodeles waltl]
MRDPDARKSRCERVEGSAIEKQRRAALTEGMAKQERNKKTTERRVAERTSRWPRRRTRTPRATLLEKRGTLSCVQLTDKRAPGRLGGREEKGLRSKGEWAVGRGREKGIKRTNRKFLHPTNNQTEEKTQE